MTFSGGQEDHYHQLQMRALLLISPDTYRIHHIYYIETVSQLNKFKNISYSNEPHKYMMGYTLLLHTEKL